MKEIKYNILDEVLQDEINSYDFDLSDYFFVSDEGEVCRVQYDLLELFIRQNDMAKWFMVDFNN